MTLDTQDDDTIGPDDFAGVFEDDPGLIPNDGQPSSDAAPAGTADASPDTPASASEPPPADAATAPSGSPPATDGAARGTEPAAPEPVSPFQRPEGATPFEFRADRTPVTVEGAWVSPDGQHIVIPRNVWDNEIRPRYVANRGEWANRERGYTDKIRGLEQSANAEVEQARAVVAQVDKLMQSGPEAVAKWLDDYERNFPLLKAEAEKAALQRQLDATAEANATRADEERQAQEVPRMQNHLAGALEGYLKDPRFTVLSGTREENVAMLRDLWMNHGDAFFVRADRDYPEYGIPKGMMVFQPDRLEQWMAREADRTTRILARNRKADAADARNKAAVAPSKPFTPATPAKPAAPSMPKPPTAPVPNQSTDFEDWKEKNMRDDAWADVLE